MEVVVYGALGVFWWLSSASVLLPFVLLLKFSKSFRDKWFAFFFVKIIGPLFDRKIMPQRKQAFKLLKEHLKVEKPEILEIGIGSGANLAFYPENSVLTALDMNESFETYYRENQKKFPQVTFKKTILARAEDMKEVQDSSMDVVISSFVLCSVEDIKSVLSEVKRVLKPGGKFLFSEHVAFPKSQWSYTVQQLVTPLWKLYFDGCFPNRDIADEIQKAGFSDVIVEKTFTKSLMLYIRPHIMGLATK